jgi:hypothetical protein
MSETSERILRNLDLASASVRKGMGGKVGDSSEKAYGIAYGKAVQAGLKPKLKKKYR